MNRPTTLKAKVSVSPHAVSIKFKHSKYKITESKTRKVRITLRPSITKEKPVYTVLNTRIATINKGCPSRKKTRNDLRNRNTCEWGSR